MVTAAALVRRQNEELDFPPSQRRVVPAQQRARDRIELIVSVTERLLATLPANKITTNAVAASADVPVSSIYRYFPNAHAIFIEIFERLTVDLHDRIGAVVSDTERMPSWRERYLAVMGYLRGLFDGDPAYRPLVRLMLTAPDLRAVKARANARIALFLGERWSRGEDGFHGGDPYVVARMVTEIFTSCESMLAGLSDPDHGNADYSNGFFQEVVVMLDRYLSPYLDER